MEQFCKEIKKPEVPVLNCKLVKCARLLISHVEHTCHSEPVEESQNEYLAVAEYIK